MDKRDLFVVYKPPIVDFMNEAAEVASGQRSAFTVPEMVELAGRALDPAVALRRPGLTDVQRIRAVSLDYLARLLQHVVGPKRVIAVDGAHESLARRIAEAGGIERVRMVFATAMSASFPELLRLFYLLAEQGIPCVGGGIHLTARPGDLNRYLRRFLSASAAPVAAVHGPCDCSTLAKIVADAEANVLAPMYSGGVQIEPDYWQRYPWIGAGQHHMRCLEVSRGCPFSCTFCSISVVPVERRRLQVRQVDDIIAEIQQTWEHDRRLQRRLRFFVSENVLAQKRDFSRVLKRIIDECPPINFVAQADALVGLDQPFLQLLRQAGCTNLLVGFESLDEDNLRAIGKKSAFALKRRLGASSVERAYREAIRRIQGAGITVMGAFILGLDYDRPGCGTRVGELMAELDLLPHPTALTALPGAPLFDRLYRDRLVYGHPDSWATGGPYPAAYSGMDLTECNVHPRLLSAGEVQRELDAVVHAVGHHPWAAAARAGWSAVRTGRRASRVVDPLLASSMVISFPRGGAKMLQRINHGARGRSGAVARLEQLAARKACPEHPESGACVA